MENRTDRRKQAESMLWSECLSEMKAPFRKNAELGGYVLDFYCPGAKLAVEVREAGEKDNYRRSEYLRRLGVELLHFTMDDVEKMSSGVYRVIESAVARRCV